MYIYKIFSEDAQHHLIEDHQAFEIRHHLDSIMKSYNLQINLDTQNEFLEYYPHLSSKEARVSILNRINQGAENFRMYVLQQVYLYARNYPNILNEHSGDRYKLFDRVRSMTSKKDWESSLQKLAKEYTSVEVNPLKKLAEFEKDGQDSIRLLRWKLYMELLEIQMQDRFMEPLRTMEKHLGLRLGKRSEVIPFGPRTEEIKHSFENSPDHYLLAHTLVGILGREFFYQRLNQAFGGTMIFTGPGFELVDPFA
ncbi:hypothetical protein CROQUDRAFT_663396 [Cronartium quercuum f. sp. fusiforme G11]|uniref:Uncharacterized protein n=1 Tax=Cronartium quercuum f. sp. fusiforme G11 TaxID=708437 RepID=A0A9P6ND09_9BASI|nr:hypothetical protein CROQUDRAFT_663396 [Cronartium quercuum f. sp. fusiforme G11]